MMHDDNPMCKSEFGFTELKNHVMSPTMESIDSAQPWSHCSRKAILNFLQDKRGECLRDRPQQETVSIKDSYINNTYFSSLQLSDSETADGVNSGFLHAPLSHDSLRVKVFSVLIENSNEPISFTD